MTAGQKSWSSVKNNVLSLKEKTETTTRDRGRRIKKEEKGRRIKQKRCRIRGRETKKIT